MSYGASSCVSFSCCRFLESNESQEHPIEGQLSSTAHCLSNIQGRESKLSGPTCVNREFPVSVQIQGS